LAHLRNAAQRKKETGTLPSCMGIGCDICGVRRGGKTVGLGFLQVGFFLERGGEKKREGGHKKGEKEAGSG